MSVVPCRSCDIIDDATPCVGGRTLGTSLIRNRTPLGPNRMPMPRVKRGSFGGGNFLMGDVALYAGDFAL